MFFGCFHCGIHLLISPTLFTASPTDLIELFLLSGVFYLKLLPEIYHSTASATDLRDIFLPSVVFYLIPLPDIWLSLVLSRLPWEPAILHSRLQDLSLRFSHRPICLFESLSVQQKVIVSRCYLCVKALQNTMSTSSKFWTHHLIAICIVAHTSYSFCPRRSS